MQKYWKYLFLSLLLTVCQVNTAWALKNEAKSSVDYYNEGIYLYNSGKYDLAIESYNKAIEINPNYANSYQDKGTLLVKTKRYDLALEAYNKAIELNPNDPVLQNNYKLLLKLINKK